jgi:hypothetical protein
VDSHGGGDYVTFINPKGGCRFPVPAHRIVPNR